MTSAAVDSKCCVLTAASAAVLGASFGVSVLRPDSSAPIALFGFAAAFTRSRTAARTCWVIMAASVALDVRWAVREPTLRWWAAWLADHAGTLSSSLGTAAALAGAERTRALAALGLTALCVLFKAVAAVAAAQLDDALEMGPGPPPTSPAPRPSCAAELSAGRHGFVNWGGGAPDGAEAAGTATGHDNHQGGARAPGGTPPSSPRAPVSPTHASRSPPHSPGAATAARADAHAQRGARNSPRGSSSGARGLDPFAPGKPAWNDRFWAAGE